MHYSSKVPVQGEQKLKCVDGASLELKMLGTRMVLAMHWEGDAAGRVRQRDQALHVLHRRDEVHRRHAANACEA